MPETSRKKDSSTDTSAAEEAHADALAQSWALARPARDLWSDIEKKLIASSARDPEVVTAEAWARQAQIPFVDLAKHQPEPDALACLPATLAYQYRTIPIRKDGNRLFVALENPRDIAAVDALRSHTGLLVQSMYAAPTQLWTFLETCYPKTNAGGSRGPVPPVPPTAVGSGAHGWDSLPPELAGVLALWQNGKTVTEIATELELTEATVKVRIHRARRKIRHSLEKPVAAPWDDVLEGATTDNPLNEILAELKALREEVGALRREVAQLRKTERRQEFGATLMPFFTAEDRGLPLG